MCPAARTVTATSDASLYALRKDLFVGTVTGHAATARVTGRIITERLDPQAGQEGPQARPA